jgi:hypothetical protein
MFTIILAAKMVIMGNHESVAWVFLGTAVGLSLSLSVK